MLIAITGTPGIGKTSVSKILKRSRYEIVDLNKVATEENFLFGFDEKRNSKIVDIDKLNEFIKDNFKEKKLIFLDGHLSHLLKVVDKIIVLRCHPDELKKRLAKKNWNKQKIKENLESEIIDVILCESVEIHPKENIFEIDTTDKSVEDVASSIFEIIKNDFKNMKKYNTGKIDWSEEILKDF